MIAANSDSGAGAGAAGLILILIFAGFYLIPTIVAIIRKVPNVGSVAVINIFLGWSIIGWVVALAMAARSVPPAQQVIINQGSVPPSAPPQPPTPPPMPPTTPPSTEGPLSQ